MPNQLGTLDDGRIPLDNSRDSGTGAEASRASLAQTKAKDIVCGRLINPRDSHTAMYAGHSYYFCSEECQVMFETDPVRFQGR